MQKELEADEMDIDGSLTNGVNGKSKGKAKIIRKAGKTSIQTFGKKITVTVTLSAPATGPFTPYRLVRVYKVK